MPRLPISGKYPPDWRDIAARVKADAGGRCVRCRHVHDVASGHVLTVHHFDGDKSNCAGWNLMALCQRCHLSVQSRVSPAQGLMHKPPVWVMPYVAGMIAAGRTPPPPGYDLQAWMDEFAFDGCLPWPDWAPQPNMEVR